MIYANSILRNTGQWWKFVVSIALTLVGGLTMLYGIFKLQGESPETLVPAIFGGMALATLGFVFGCIAIRCDECGARIFWHAVSRQKSHVWFLWLMSESNCPSCKAEAHKQASH